MQLSRAAAIRSQAQACGRQRRRQGPPANSSPVIAHHAAFQPTAPLPTWWCGWKQRLITPTMKWAMVRRRNSLEGEGWMAASSASSRELAASAAVLCMALLLPPTRCSPAVQRGGGRWRRLAQATAAQWRRRWALQASARFRAAATCTHTPSSACWTHQAQPSLRLRSPAARLPPRGPSAALTDATCC